ncbi:MAG: peptidase T [Chloroflexota bacterium]|nr:peptidase T [Chloroflexota bacterium]
MATVTETAPAPFSSPLAAEVAPEVLQRFLRYVRIDTQSQEDSPTYPSTSKQLDLSRLLAAELQSLGLLDAAVDEHGYVMATLSATVDHGGPTVGLVAHVDTSPEASGRDVTPRVIDQYDGGDISFPGDPQQALRPADNPDLRGYRGHDLVTSDGTTLLGADDKAGVAEIMAAVAYLVAHPEIPHGRVRIAFTPDEEIGQGTKHFDLRAFGADLAYTVDGSTAGEIQDETFSASSVTVIIRGHNTHPGYAKGKMVNSIKLAADLLARLPREGLSPETTAGREGYVHPMAIEGGVEETTLRFIARDFSADDLVAHESLLQRAADEIAAAEPRARVSVAIQRSYRNMKEYLAPHPRALAAAETAIRRAGLEPQRAAIRGGTDGARLSEQGLPTPNLFTGAHDYHSVREWISVQDMGAATATLIHLVQVWAETP